MTCFAIVSYVMLWEPFRNEWHIHSSTGANATRMSNTSTKKTIPADAFDRRFDEGEDVSDFVDWSKARRINQAQKCVNVDFPIWMIAGLDREAKRVGVTRQSIIKMWLAERLDQTKP